MHDENIEAATKDESYAEFPVNPLCPGLQHFFLSLLSRTSRI